MGSSVKILRHALRVFKHRRRIARALASLEQPVPAAAPHCMDTPLVVSLTSYRPRFGNLALTLRCLVQQSIRPDEIILWISPDDMPHLPADVLALQDTGITIREADDMLSFKKILPALRAYPDATIVTADDDVFYARDWLSKLVEGHAATGAKVVCCRAHEIRFDADGTLLMYTQWHTNVDGPCQSTLLFPTGVSGVLYRPDALDTRVLDYDLATTLCPQGDDIWLYWMQRMAGTTAYRLPGHTRVLEWELEPTVSLRQDNLGKGGNDTQIKKMISRFGIPIN